MQKSKLFTDSGVKRVVISAILFMVFSTLLSGMLVFNVAEQGVVDKLKSRDLHTIANLVATKIDQRIQNVMNVSENLSNDPDVHRWLQNEYSEFQAQQDSLLRLNSLAQQFGFDHSFIVSTSSKEYWTEQGVVAEIISEDDPFDKWYFDTLNQKKKVTVNFDYNKERGDTFVFTNALAGSVNSPIGIAGFGLNLRDLSVEFAQFTRDQGIRMWLVDGSGTVLLSDHFEDYGKQIQELLPSKSADELLQSKETRIIDYVNTNMNLYDAINYPLESTEVQMIVEVDRQATVGFLGTVRWNGIWVTILLLITTTVMFFYLSRKLANPYKRALQLNKELEEIVEERTKQLQERNDEITDSIDYAKRLQESILPSEQDLEELLGAHFVISRPKDIVGGDFYWTKKIGNKTIIAVGDCTGHGVPGAFMTLLTVSALERLVEHNTFEHPSDLLAKLNQLIKKTLNQESKEGYTNDGLDLSLCFIEGNRILYAGARGVLYGVCGDRIDTWSGNRKSIGYRNTPADYTYIDYEIPLNEHSIFYLTTDGITDQSGGENGYSFGKTRFKSLISNYHKLSMVEQKVAFNTTLDEYMGNEVQRDDITLIAFCPRRERVG